MPHNIADLYVTLHDLFGESLLQRLHSPLPSVAAPTTPALRRAPQSPKIEPAGFTAAMLSADPLDPSVPIQRPDLKPPADGDDSATGPVKCWEVPGPVGQAYLKPEALCVSSNYDNAFVGDFLVDAFI